VPFERVVEELRPERDLSRTPLFQVLFVLQNTPAQTPRLPGLELRALEIEDAAARFDLTLEMTETDEGLRGEFTYNADLFEAATVARMSEHFANLLRAVASGPGERISRLRLSSPEELRQLLCGWNGARADYPRGRCIQELFEAQAAHTPDALAVRSDEESLSYRELNERANRLARYLRRLGAGPESKVGVSLERSAEMIVCLLGVLKAGAAYVPLSPAYPRERLAFLLADAGVRVIVRRRRAEEETPDGPRVVALEDEREHIAREGGGNPPPTATPENLAYVIYTSGSTGKPKGVGVTHHGLVHSTQARLAFYGESVRCFLLVSPFVFDSSVAGIFWTLCAGGVLALPPEDFQRDLARFVASMARDGVSDLLCLPSLYALMLGQGARAEFESLRRVIVAGEVCPGELVGRHFETLPRTLLLNEYGPTEGTVWSTVHQCTPEDSAARVPIGRPVAGVRIYVLDASGQLAPHGIVGELYIGGAQLARGYLSRPAQTAARFVPDPFSGEAGARLYRTGDLARLRPDGRLEFLGRADQQVKIRGYRIEPGEIEATLVSHERVREALVVVREDGAAGPRLVGYVVPSAAPPTAGELRAFLKERLPEYMTPSVFVMLEELPRTTSGKPDRRRLPAPDASRPTLDVVYVAPQTKLEQSIAAVWREVLGLEKVGVRDNFFDLGGHSLLIVEAHLKLRERLGREIPVVALFSHPTVEALARHLNREEGEPPAETDGSRRAAARRASLGARARGGGRQPG
jgi:amino acid adenylation domain-containing protein